MENQTQNQRGHYTPEEKQQLIEKWQQSGLSRLAYCRQNNVSYYSFMNWTRSKRVRRKAKTSEFIPLKINADTDRVFAQIETGGKRIHLYQPVTAAFLKRLLG